MRAVLVAKLVSCALALHALEPAVARATLEEDAARVTQAWEKRGLTVARKPPVFLDQGRVRAVPVVAGDRTGECTSVAVIGPRGADFVLGRESTGHPLVTLGTAARLDRAAAGLLVIARCGVEREELESAVIEMRSARAALEILVATGAERALPGVEALPERVVVAPRPIVDPGRQPGADSLAQRAGRVEARARADGARAIGVTESASSPEGGGRTLIQLREGCHRIELVSELGAEGRVADIDAELRDASTNSVLTRDRSDSADARLETCTAEPLAAWLHWSGAPMRARVARVEARWPLPSGLPKRWGPRARAALAIGHIRRRTPRLTEAPLHESLGVSGATTVPLEVEAGRCYLASLAAMRGEARTLTLSGHLEGNALRDDGGSHRDGATIAFCSLRTERAVLRVDARGRSLAWVLALWKLNTLPADAVAP